jgi:hypothetical protein
MAILSVDRITIYNLFYSWEAYHFAGLYDKKDVDVLQSLQMKNMIKHNTMLNNIREI